MPAFLPPALLLRAYSGGVFPMAETRDAPEVFWVDPPRRGILPLDGFHLSRSLARGMRRGGYRVSLDADFDAVLDGCADRPDTWISGPIRAAYQALHARGNAHSLEIWEEGTLTGGVYGVALGGAFFGESMFSRRRDASKRALAHLVDHLRRCGFTLFDTQFLTPHLARLGGIEISRADYLDRLGTALGREADLYAMPLEPDPAQVVQRMTQTS